MGEVYNCSKLGHEDSELVSRRKGAHIKIRFFKRHSSPVEVFRSLHRNPDDKYMNKRKYSDQEIADAICRICGIQDSSLVQQNTDLKSFLLALHEKTRPAKEHEFYPKILEENIAQAEQFIWRG